MSWHSRGPKHSECDQAGPAGASGDRHHPPCPPPASCLYRNFSLLGTPLVPKNKYHQRSEKCSKKGKQARRNSDSSAVKQAKGLSISLKGNRGFPGGTRGKEPACHAGDSCSIPGLGRSPGAGTGNPLLHSFLENPMDRGAWQATVHRVTKSQTRLKGLSTHTHARATGNILSHVL